LKLQLRSTSNLLCAAQRYEPKLLSFKVHVFMQETIKGTIMDFKQTQQTYVRLKDQLEQGRVTAEEFEARVNEMFVTDSAGDLWQIGVKTGKWYRYDGQNWVEDVPREFVQTSNAVPPKAVYVTPAHPVGAESESNYQDQNQPRKNTWLSGLLIVGALGLCCLVFAVGGWLAWRNNLLVSSPVIPSSVAPLIPSVTAVVPSMASPGPIAGPGFDPGLVLFQDDFSNPGSGWNTYQDSNGSTDYSNGSFRIKVTATDYLLWTNPKQSLQNDISINVDATKAGGPDDNAFGIICRHQDNDNFYYFVITSEGYAGISMFKNGEKIWLTGDSLIPSDAIHQGAATNSIRADCAGSTLTLYVNNQQIVSATDSSFSGGGVGLIAKAYGTPGVDILFDTFMVFKARY
jgi:hypothetical protein